MIEYIAGLVTELNPAYVVLEAGSIGYCIHISLTTYDALSNCESCRLWIHEAIREDAHLLYGFAGKEERELFRLLISVSGIGPNTARVMLSSMDPVTLGNAIADGDVKALKSVKGIGLKTAERVIVDLKDKIVRRMPAGEIVTFADNTAREEALSALVMLGFAKNSATKVVDNLVKENRNLSAEELVRQSLKLL
ncbi:MAG TPA: Holliday junction branch migration protein RuvA [Bacteroidales bacterium]|nr:Holliday junction branch migration protein RuvA [Bacteroidales bacterium]HPT11844.1 Holliday junction branch migration protein RuvA [Bacteroidales bacterium]